MSGSAAEYGIVTASDIMVEMRDGVRLATDVYWPGLPDGRTAPGRFPTILGRTSYDKGNKSMWIDAVAKFFTPRGYVTVLQDLRGRGNSGGPAGTGTSTIRRKVRTAMTRSDGSRRKTGPTAGSAWSAARMAAMFRPSRLSTVRRT